MRIFLIVLLMHCLRAVAQDEGFTRGDMLVGFNIGATHLNKLSTRANINTAEFKKNFRGEVSISKVNGAYPMGVRYEYAFSEIFGLGISVAWWNVTFTVKDTYSSVNILIKDKITDVYNYKLTSTSFGLRPTMHLPTQIKKLDVYVACAIGMTKNDILVDIPTAKAYYSDSQPLTLYLAPLIGARRFITDNFGLNLEVGYEKGALLLGGILLRFRPAPKYVPVK